MKNFLKLMAFSAVSAILAACGGGGSSESSGSSPQNGGGSASAKIGDYTGVWRGASSSSSGNARTSMLLRSDGAAWIVSFNEAAGLIGLNDGRANLSGSTLTLTGMSYLGVAPSVPTQVSATLTGPAKGTISGISKINGTTAEVQVSLTYEKAVSENPAPLSLIAGNYYGSVYGNARLADVMETTISSSGLVKVTLGDGCKSSGSLTPVGPSFNITMTTDSASCGGVRTSSGVATFDGSVGTVILVSSDKTAAAIAVLAKR